MKGTGGALQSIHLAQPTAPQHQPHADTQFMYVVVYVCLCVIHKVYIQIKYIHKMLCWLIYVLKAKFRCPEFYLKLVVELRPYLFRESNGSCINKTTGEG